MVLCVVWCWLGKKLDQVGGHVWCAAAGLFSRVDTFPSWSRHRPGGCRRVVASLCRAGGAPKRIAEAMFPDRVDGHVWCATDGFFSGADAVVCLLALGPDQMTDNSRQCSVLSDSGTTVSSGALGRGAERVAVLASLQATFSCRVVGPVWFAAGGPADSDREDGHA